MTAKAKIFNPAEFLPADQNESKAEESKDQTFISTGNSSRDHVRKKLQQIFAQESGDVNLVKKLVDQIENTISQTYKEPKSKEYREKTKDIMIKLDKKTPAIQELKRQLMAGEVKPDMLLSEEFLSAKGTKAQGPSSGMPAMGQPGMRPVGVRGMAAPGQAVRPRGGAPFNPSVVARGGVAPRGMFRPIGAFNPKPQQETSPRDTGIQFDTSTSAANISAFEPEIFIQETSQPEAKPHHQQPQQKDLHEPTQLQIHNHVHQIIHEPIQERVHERVSEPTREEIPAESNFYKTIQENEPHLDLSTSLNKTGILVMDSSANTTAIQSQIDASLDDSNDHSQETSKAKKKKKVKKRKVQPEVEQEQQVSQVDKTPMLQNQPESSSIEQHLEQYSIVTHVLNHIEHHAEHFEHNLEQRDEVDTHLEPHLHVESFQSQQVETHQNQHAEPVINVQVEHVVQQVQQEQQHPLQQSLEYGEFVGEQVQEMSTFEDQAPNNQQQENGRDHFLPRYDSMVERPHPQIKSPTQQSRIEAIQSTQQPLFQQPQQEEIHVPHLNQPNQANQLLSAARLQSQIEEESKIQTESTFRTRHDYNVEQDNQVLLLQKKLQLLAEENKHLRETSRQAKTNQKKAEDNVSSAQVKDGYQLQLQQAQMKLKDQTIDKLKLENQRVTDERDMLKQRLLQLQKESQQFREQLENQLQQVMIHRSTFDNIDSHHQIQSHSNQNNQNKSNAEASNQQELRKEMQIMRQQYESQLEDKEIELQNRTKELQQIERRNVSLAEANKTLSDSLSEMHAAANPNVCLFAGSGSFQSARIGQSAPIQSQPLNSNYQAAGIARNGTRPRTNDIGSSQLVIVPESFNINVGQGIQMTNQAQTSQLFMDSGEAEEGGIQGERYFQEITQDEGTGGESYNQQNQQTILNMSHPPQSSSGHSGSQQHISQQYVINGSRAAAFYGVGGDEQMRFQNHGGGVGDGFDGGYGNAVEEDSADDSQEEEYNSEPERVRALDQEEEDPEEDDIYLNYAYSGDSYGQHNVSQSQQQIKDRASKIKPGQTDIGGFQDEVGDEEEQMLLGGQGVSVYDNVEGLNDSEPEEGRERDKNHHLKDGDGTGDQNIEGDLDGDGDLSNSNLNDDDIMGDEAHSAPAGGDFQEGDFDGEERSRGEEGGCREMINDGEDGIEQIDLIDEVNMDDPMNDPLEPIQEYPKFAKISSSSAVESTQTQFGSQGHIGASKFQFSSQRYNNHSREQADQYEEEEGGEGLPNQGHYNGRFEDGEEAYQYEDNPFEEEKVHNNNQGYQQHSGLNQQVFNGFQTSATQIVGHVQKQQNVGAINDFGERPQPFIAIRSNNRQTPPQSQSQMGQGQSAGGSSKPASKAGAAASSNQQHSVGPTHEESSNGGASVICQTNTVGAAATSARRSITNAQAAMQPGNGGQRNASTSQMISATQLRNPRRGNNKQTRQGGGGGGNMQRQQQTQSSSQTRVQGQGGRNSRGTQRSNQQQFVAIMQVAPAGGQEAQTQLPASGTTSHQSKQLQQPQQTQAFNSQQHHLYSQPQTQIQVMGAPSSQASATGNIQKQDSRQRASGGGTSSPNSSSQAQSQSNFQTAQTLPESLDSGSGVAQLMGNAQSSSMASGGANQTNGSVSTMQSALSQVQHMPASHASATAKGNRPSILNNKSLVQENGRGSGGSRAGHAGGAMATRQSSAAMISQQKGVVHTANQILGRPAENGVAAPNAQHCGSGGGMDTGSGSGGVSSSTLLQNQIIANRHSSEINAESGSTALTNQANYIQTTLVQAASQNQQTYQNEIHLGIMSGSQASALQQVSSPPSTSQTGGNNAQQQHVAFQSSDHSHQHPEGLSAAGGETDFYIGAVGAPPSRAAVITQKGQGKKSSTNQTNQGSGNGQSASTNHRMQMSSSQDSSQTIQSNQAAQASHHCKQSSANNSQSQASHHAHHLQQQYEYGNTSNHQSQNIVGEIGGAEQQSLERLPTQPQSSSVNNQSFGRGQVRGTTGEQETSERKNLQFNGGVRGINAFNNSSGGSFANETTIQSQIRMQRPERQNIQDSMQLNNMQRMQLHYPQGSTQTIQTNSTTDQSRGQQMNSQPNQWVKKYNFDETTENLSSIQGSQMHSSQAASGINTIAQLQQREDSRKTSGANTPSKDGADTPPYRNEQSHQQKRANDSQIFNLTSKKLLVLQNQDDQVDGSTSREGQETDTCPQNLFE